MPGRTATPSCATTWIRCLNHSAIVSPLSFPAANTTPYVGAVIRKYHDDMPVWVFCEVMPLGVFAGLIKFCADRWEDAELRQIHYLLKNTRSVRNYCAHGSCSVNGLLQRGSSARPPTALVNELTAAGVPKRLRAKWLRGERMVNTCATLYLYRKVVPKGTVRSERETALKALFTSVERCGHRRISLLKTLVKRAGRAKLNIHNKAFGLIGAGLRKRFCPVFSSVDIIVP